MFPSIQPFTCGMLAESWHEVHSGCREGGNHHRPRGLESRLAVWKPGKSKLLARRWGFDVRNSRDRSENPTSRGHDIVTMTIHYLRYADHDYAYILKLKLNEICQRQAYHACHANVIEMSAKVRSRTLLPPCCFSADWASSVRSPESEVTICLSWVEGFQWFSPVINCLYWRNVAVALMFNCPVFPSQTFGFQNLQNTLPDASDAKMSPLFLWHVLNTVNLKSRRMVSARSIPCCICEVHGRRAAENMKRTATVHTLNHTDTLQFSVKKSGITEDNPASFLKFIDMGVTKTGRKSETSHLSNPLSTWTESWNSFNDKTISRYFKSLSVTCFFISSFLQHGFTCPLPGLRPHAIGSNPMRGLWFGRYVMEHSRNTPTCPWGHRFRGWMI